MNFVVKNVAVYIALIILAINLAAQNQPKSGERGFNPGKSYAVSDIESIGLFSGNVMFNVPLGSLPAGRGAIGGGVGINYNSKIWDTFVTDITRFTTTHDKTTLVPSPEGGWKYNYKHYLKLDYRNLGTSTGNCTFGTDDSYTTIKVQLVGPDGSQHLMIPGNTGTIGTDLFSDVYPDGRLLCNPVAVTSGNIVTFYSKDNSFLRLEVLTDTDTNWENNTWTLYAADGSKIYTNPGSSTRQTITDRNGNYVQIVENTTDSNYSNHRTTYIKDQLDRKVVIEYAAATNEDRIHSKGVAGETVTTRVVWKDVAIDKSYFACEMAPSPLNQNAWENYGLTESLKMVDKIYLPSQIESGSMFYDFDYNADGAGSPDTGWGEISKITLPSGAFAEYEYFYDTVSGSSVTAEDILLNRIVEKNLTYDKEYDLSTTGQTDTWVYDPTATYDALQNLTSVAVIGPDGGTTTEYYVQDPDRKGEVYKAVGPDGSISEKVYAINAPLSFLASEPNTNRFVKYEFNTIADSGGSPSKTAIKEYSQDKNGNTTEVKEYDFVSYGSIPRDGNGLITGLPSGISSSLKRITKTEFYNPVPDSQTATYNDADSYHLTTSERLLRLAKNVEVQDGSASPKSRSEFDYDFENYDSSNTKAGNLTETKTWDSFKGGSAQSYSNPLTGTNSHSTSAVYNSYGMPTKTTDANSNDTVITYGNVTCPGGTVTDLYPTLTETAEGTAVERTSSAVYDCYTGLVTTATDEDNDVSVVNVYDDLGRPTIVKNAYGTGLESWVQTEYHDADRYVVTKADLEAKDDRKKIAIQHFDQLGRVRLSRTLENAAAEDPDDEQDGIKVQTRYATTYSSPNGYTYSLTSNPYRAATSSAASSEPTMGWTRSKAHQLGKHSEVETFSGATLPAPWGANTTSTGMVQTDIDANATTVTDQASKVRRSITNGLGQLTRVDEPTGPGLGTVGSPNQVTEYSYDTLGNLLQVDQGAQDRIFTYSSLSRLRSANNPESGTVTYSYDPNGNLTSKVDARSITTSYTYDAQNRVTDRDYSDTTPDVDYTYDNKTNAYGKLTKVSSSVSATEYLTFDILGRVTSHKQTTDSNDYTTGYTYSLAGQLLEQEYPGGRIVKNSYDAADGSLSQVQSKRSGETYRNFANGLIYNAAGGVEAIKLGNGKWENTVFNSRLQPTQIGLGIGVNSQNLLKLAYSYGTTANNGNVVSQTITIPGIAHNFVQTYTYDELNRLTNAEEIKNSVQQWEQTFTYDRFGNRNFNEAETTTLPKNCGSAPSFTVCAPDKKIVNPGIDDTKNRLDEDDNYDYDAVGNTTADAAGRTFIYDAENKQIEVLESSVPIGQYSYDGDGRRIKKVVPGGETTIFIYDAAGRLIQEHSTIVQTGNDAKTVYTTNDALGSPRINTDATGQVISRHDYHPFGEEIARTGYGSDTIRKQFTGYERDNETDLDFAQARMYANRLGRFSTVDSVGPDLTNPQTLNKYQYCLNNPLRYIDKNGKYEEDVHRDLTRELAFAAGFSMRQATAIGSENQYIDEGRTNPVGYGPEAYGARSKHHFTTQEQRNSLWGDFENAASSQNETNQLMRLGTYLHAQQDSFSHDGYGPLLGQATDLFKDGIVPSYEAASRVDKTDNDPAKAERMAEDSFKRLVSARNTLAGTGRSGSFYRPISYGAIKPLVARWVRESDPQKKAALLGEIRRKIQNGRDVQNFPKNVVTAPKKKRQEEE